MASRERYLFELKRKNSVASEDFIFKKAQFSNLGYPIFNCCPYFQEKERTNEIRRFELEFLKGWSNVKDDLNLEDLKVRLEMTREYSGSFAIFVKQICFIVGTVA